MVTIPSDFDPPPSGRLTIVVVQHSAQPLAVMDESRATGVRLFLHDEPVAQPLVVPLAMINDNESGDPFRKPADQGSVQCSLPTQGYCPVAHP